MRQARYWIFTIPRELWTPCLPDGVSWIYGQPERGESGYLHHQFIAAFVEKKTRNQAKSYFVPGAHLEPTRSTAAEAYCRKEDTRDGEPYEFGSKPICRSRKTDWDRIKMLAQSSQLGEIPSDIYVRYYRTLCAIAADHDRPVGIEKKVWVFVGPTGTGKSRRAWEEAGEDAYAKDPRSKFWCGYQSQKNIVLDEFRGGIDISHMLRWLDRYPVRVEIKGGSRPLCAETVWITSNILPEAWYPELDSATMDALRRRLDVVIFE